MLGANVAARKDRRPLDRVGQLSDVARPVVREQGLDRVVGQINVEATTLGVEPADHVSRQGWHVGLALAERRQDDLKHVDPEEEVLAEGVGEDHLE